MTIHVKPSLAGVALTGMAAVFSCEAWAADPGVQSPAYPSRPVTMVVPFTPGGVSDILARVAANGLTSRLGQAFLVENKPGADGDIGAADVAAAAPDGYTLLVGPASTNAINPLLHKNLKFDPRHDFVAIANLGTVPNVLVVSPGIKVKTVPELIQMLKTGDYSFASGGVGGSQHLSGELFKAMTHTRILHIPYKGGNAQMSDLLSGRVDMMFCNLPVCLPFIRSGRLTALGVTTKERSPLLPDVPTVAQAGVPGYAVEGWFGLFAPIRTPKTIVDKLGAAVVAVMNDPKTRQLLIAQGATPSQDNPEQFGAYVRSEQDRWAKVIHEAGIKAE